MTVRYVAWGLVTVLALGALGLWLYNQGEWVEHELTVGYQGEAARNPYLAAGRLLRRMGVPAAELPRRDWVEGPPPTLDVLVIASERHALTGPWLEQLLAWVQEGGHLMVRATTRRDEGEPDALLTALGVASHHYDDATGSGPVTLRVAGAELAAEFQAAVRLTAETDFTSLGEDDRGSLGLAARVGRGRVTVLAGFGPFTNRRIGDHDHARLLLALVAPEGRSPVVGITLDEDMPGLMAWLWQRIPEALVSLGLLTVLALGWRGHRFGRLAEMPPPARRSLLEHIEAGGWFLWRRGHGRHLLEALRAALIRRAAGRMGGIADRPHGEQVRLIARMSGVPAREVAAALALPPTLDARTFTRQAAALETIRKKL